MAEDRRIRPDYYFGEPLYGTPTFDSALYWWIRYPDPPLAQPPRAEPIPDITFPLPTEVFVPNAPPPGPVTPEKYPLEQLPGREPSDVVTVGSGVRFGGPNYEEPAGRGRTRRGIERAIIRDGARRGKPFWAACDDIGLGGGDSALEYCHEIVSVEEYERIRRKAKAPAGPPVRLGYPSSPEMGQRPRPKPTTPRVRPRRGTPREPFVWPRRRRRADEPLRRSTPAPKPGIKVIPRVIPGFPPDWTSPFPRLPRREQPLPVPIPRTPTPEVPRPAPTMPVPPAPPIIVIPGPTVPQPIPLPPGETRTPPPPRPAGPPRRAPAPRTTPAPFRWPFTWPFRSPSSPQRFPRFAPETPPLNRPGEEIAPDPLPLPSPVSPISPAPLPAPSQPISQPLTQLQPSPLSSPATERCPQPTKRKRRKCRNRAAVRWAGGPKKGQLAGTRCYAFFNP